MNDTFHPRVGAQRPVPVTPMAPERRASDDQVRQLRRQLIDVQERERVRIARNLHDVLGQDLTALRLRIESLRREDLRSDLKGRIEDVLRLTEVIDREVDFLAWELRPAALDDLGLARALDAFVREWSQTYHIAAEFRAAPPDGRVSADVEECLYRIAQEALHNVVKHAAAARVAVLLEQRAGWIVLIVEDDGCGFEPGRGGPADGIACGMGLMDMRERVALLSGRLEIESGPGKGTAIFAAVPAAFACGADATRSRRRR